MTPVPPPRSPAASRARRARTRRRVGATVATLTASALVAAGLWGASPAPGQAEPGGGSDMPETLQAAPSPLRTPFEESNGARWTTVPESQRFWRQLDRSSDRVKVTRVGRSVEGRPLQLVAVGDPAPASAAEAAEGSVLMYTCSVHGDENSGREACMRLARDMSTTTDPAWRRLLRDTTVLFINLNPDGWVANTRQNAQGLDVNRDYMALESPEARTVVKLIRDWKPDVLNDLHEYGPNPYYRTDLLQLWPRNRQVDPTVHDLARTMSEDYAGGQVEASGYTSGEYGIFVKDGEPFRQVAGDEQGRILRNYAGLQHVAGMLSETANEPLDAEEEADEALTNRRRVEVNYLSAVGSAQFTLENRDTLLRETAAAAERAIAKGASRSGVVYFAGQDNVLPTEASDVEPEPMCGYQLTLEQRRDVARTLRLHGITWRNNAEGSYVTMAQEDQPLIPLLLDARSEYRITEATPVEVC
ncbi:M14 family zinc carboxypeptidase [Nocardioides sp. zg-DK7169]|uniref:M14 family zinc carboxypeptidase n=1 Tax=Nocardioides sp. zg-DK7169 TaxID=2736600 RepID=UPI001552AC61|nr:M14 family zinc carboxypeptidase [Nocardioides sp. zg-DK7169]NPC97236.1 carboxypeptidase [Nocardioides sp. zg-DK7169]